MRKKYMFIENTLRDSIFMVQEQYIYGIGGGAKVLTYRDEKPLEEKDNRLFRAVEGGALVPYDELPEDFFDNFESLKLFRKNDFEIPGEDQECQGSDSSLINQFGPSDSRDIIMFSMRVEAKETLKRLIDEFSFVKSGQSMLQEYPWFSLASGILDDQLTIELMNEIFNEKLTGVH